LNNAGYVAALHGDYDRADLLFLKALEENPAIYP